MSVDSSRSRNTAQTDMSDLQSEYTKKKKKFSQEQEEQLGEMKDHYDQRKAEVRDQGEAAVNHIRSKQSESVATATESRKKIAERSEAQMNGVEENYRKKIAENQARRQEQLDMARGNGREKIDTIQQDQQEKIKQVREESTADIQNVKEKYNRELQRTQDFTGKRLDEIKDSNEKTLHTEINKGVAVQDKLRENLKKDYDTTNTLGERKIQDRQMSQEDQYERMDADYDKRFHKQKDQWDSREKNVVDQYSNRIQHTKKAYEQQLKDQGERFHSIYGKNDEANKDSLRIQNNNLLKEQIELKKKFFKESEKYAGKEDDPFYKIEDRGNRLRESSDFYIVDAYAPEHEKDSLKVTIRPDHAAISGKRVFRDEVAEDGRKVSTNNYQTFREEFAFDKPVITEGMTRERSGDYVTYYIPKLNSFDTPPPKLKKIG